MKEMYQVAEMDVFNFSMEDVISTSATETTVLIPPSNQENVTPEMDPIT